MAVPAIGMLLAATMLGCGDDDAGTASEPTEPNPIEPVPSEPMDSDPTHTEPEPETPSTSRAPTSRPSTSRPSTSDALAESAVADLANRLDVGASDIVVVLVEDVTWPDGSIGCPERGFQYQQVLTPGVRVTLSVGGVQYRYHAGGARDLFYCATPQPAVEDGTS